MGRKAKELLEWEFMMEQARARRGFLGGWWRHRFAPALASLRCARPVVLGYCPDPDGWVNIQGTKDIQLPAVDRLRGRWLGFGLICGHSHSEYRRWRLPDLKGSLSPSFASALRIRRSRRTVPRRCHSGANGGMCRADFPAIRRCSYRRVPSPPGGLRFRSPGI